MGGGKGKAPPPPDYSKIAAANKEAAEIAAKSAAEQLAWAKEQYAMDRADNKEITDTYLPLIAQQVEAAQKDRARYENLYQPLEDSLVAEAQAYGTEARKEFEAGRAISGVDEQFQQARKAAEANLTSYGLDPGQVRAGALDLGTRLQEAAAKAGAGNTARINTENVARALRSEAINIGRGYPGQVAQSVDVASGTGTRAAQTNLATTASGAATMGTGVQYSGIQNQALGNWGDYSSRVYSAQQAANAAQQGGLWGAIGTIGGIGAKMAFSDRKLKENLQRVGKLDDGTPVYTYNMKGDGEPRMGVVAQDVEKRDPGAVVNTPAGKAVDYGRVTKSAIDARGENDASRIPEDVLRRKGTEFFDKLYEKTRGGGTSKSGGKKQALPVSGGEEAGGDLGSIIAALADQRAQARPNV